MASRNKTAPLAWITYYILLIGQVCLRPCVSRVVSWPRWYCMRSYYEQLIHLRRAPRKEVPAVLPTDMDNL